MKVNKPPPVVPPVAPVVRLPVPAGLPGQAHPQAAAAGHLLAGVGPAPQGVAPEPQRHGAEFRSPRSGRRGGGGGGGGKHGANRGQINPRPPARSGASAAQDEPSSQGEGALGMADDYEERRHRSGYALRADASHRDDGQGGGGDEGERQERYFASIAAKRPGPPRAAAALAPAQQVVQSAVATAGAAEDLAAPLRALALGAQGDAGTQGMSGLLLRALRDWLARQGPGSSGGAATLASIRAALLAGPPAGAVAAPGARPPSALLWLPAFLLNLDRPRTPEQREQAIARLDMLLRASSRRRDLAER